MRPAELDSADIVMNSRPERFYFNREFDFENLNRDDDAVDRVGQVARYAYKVFDTNRQLLFEKNGHEVVLRESEIRRVQLKALFFEDDREIAQLVFQRFNRANRAKEHTISLSMREVRILLNFLRIIQEHEFSGPEGDRLDPHTVRAVASSPEARAQVYSENREQIFSMIEHDPKGRDVIAWKARRDQYKVFEQMLSDRDRYAEPDWQEFFEKARWIFGLGLSSQVLLSWEKKLEATLRGFSVTGPGRRPDALLQSAGAVRALSLVAIKTPQAPLLGAKYRGNAWQPGTDVSGGVVQCHKTIDDAIEEVGFQLQGFDDEGHPTGAIVQLCRPKCYLVVGHLDQFINDKGALSTVKYRSFENYRRTTTDPEIVTYDELLGRARHIVGA